MHNLTTTLFKGSSFQKNWPALPHRKWSNIISMLEQYSSHIFLLVLNLGSTSQGFPVWGGGSPIQTLPMETYKFWFPLHGGSCQIMFAFVSNKWYIYLLFNILKINVPLPEALTNSPTPQWRGLIGMPHMKKSVLTFMSGVDNILCKS